MMQEIGTNGRNLIITHGADVDGLSAAVLGRLVLPSLDIVLVERKELILALKRVVNSKYDNIYVTDLPFDMEEALLIDSNLSLKQKIKHFDHHILRPGCEKFDFINSVVEKNGIKESGTSLFYDYLVKEYSNNEALNSGLVKTFVAGVKKYDTSADKDNFDYQIGHKLTSFFVLYGAENYIKTFHHRFITRENNLFQEHELREIEDQENRINNYVNECERRLFKMTIDEDYVGVSISDRYRTAVGIALSNNHPELDYILIVDYSRQAFSLRTTKNDISLNEIAQKYGGGGHKQAAGMPMNEISLPLLDYINSEIQKQMAENKPKI